jgi:hypothetical protein
MSGCGFLAVNNKGRIPLESVNFLFGLHSVFGLAYLLGKKPVLRRLQDHIDHLFIADSVKSSHLGQMTVPAPTRIGIDLQQSGITRRIESPVEPAVIPALQSLG